MKRLDSTPIQDGFRMPGEYEPHSGCYIVWPEHASNWRLEAKPAQEVFLKVINTIAKYEAVSVLVSNRQFGSVLNLVDTNVRVIEMSNDDTWVRDFGTTFVINNKGEIRGVDWRYNAWRGLAEGRFITWENDDIIGAKIAELERVNRYDSGDFVLEGGSIHVDGEGTVLVTEECLLSENSNLNMTKKQIEKILCDYLNCSKVLWIPEGIYNDGTNGYVDNICRFIRPGVVVLAWTDEETNPQYLRSKKALEYLMSETDAKGRKLEIHKLSLPAPVVITKEESDGAEDLIRNEGNCLMASYVNYYIANKAIILPVFNDSNDAKAVYKLKELYPDYTIETVYARELILGGGNIHSITQQVPKGK